MSYINSPGKDTAWENHAINNLVSDIILYGGIQTSLPLARRLTKLLAKLITWSKKNTLHSRRLALRYLVNKKHLGVVDKLFSEEIREKYKNRAGGYTRIVKMGFRRGDGASRVFISLV